jgi:hypothetical protein
MTFRCTDDSHCNFRIVRQSMANATRYKMPWQRCAMSSAMGDISKLQGELKFL